MLFCLFCFVIFCFVSTGGLIVVTAGGGGGVGGDEKNNLKQNDCQRSKTRSKHKKVYLF